MIGGFSDWGIPATGHGMSPGGLMDTGDKASPAPYSYAFRADGSIDRQLAMPSLLSRYVAGGRSWTDRRGLVFFCSSISRDCRVPAPLLLLWGPGLACSASPAPFRGLQTSTVASSIESSLPWLGSFSGYSLSSLARCCKAVPMRVFFVGGCRSRCSAWVWGGPFGLSLCVEVSAVRWLPPR